MTEHPMTLEDRVAKANEDIRALCDFAERVAEEIETGRDWGGSPLERLDEEGKILDRTLLARVRLAVATGPAPPAPEPVCANQDCGHKQDEHYSGECWGSPGCSCSAFVSAPPAPEPDVDPPDLKAEWQKEKRYLVWASVSVAVRDAGCPEKFQRTIVDETMRRIEQILGVKS